MPRYYESESLIDFVKQNTPHINGETTMECVERAIQKAPTAYVVPKSEVERLTVELEAMRTAANSYKMHYENAKAEVKALTENNITAKYPNCVLGSYYAILTKSLEDYDKLIADISAETKAEVAREIFEDISKASVDWGCYCLTLSKGAFLAEDVNRTLNELKKKYIDGD